MNRGSFGLKFPVGVEEKAKTEIASIAGAQVTFTDGSSQDYDVIIKATGFLHDFPFIEQTSLRL